MTFPLSLWSRTSRPINFHLLTWMGLEVPALSQWEKCVKNRGLLIMRCRPLHLSQSHRPYCQAPVVLLDRESCLNGVRTTWRKRIAHSDKLFLGISKKYISLPPRSPFIPGPSRLACKMVRFSLFIASSTPPKGLEPFWFELCIIVVIWHGYIWYISESSLENR